MSLRKKKECALAIAKSSGRIANLLNNLLDFANICRNDFNLNLEPLNLYKNFQDKIFKSNNNIQFTANFDDDLTLFGNKYLISRLLDNLSTSITFY